MKKLIIVYLCAFLFVSQMHLPVLCQNWMEDTYNKKSDDNSLVSKMLSGKSDCESCDDKVLLELKKKDTLSIEEKKVYAILQQTCEDCKSRNYQIQAINRQTQVIDDKSSAATPLWFVIVTGIVAGVFIALSK